MTTRHAQRRNLETPYNITIVREDATTVTFQSNSGFHDICREVARMSKDPFYKMNGSDPVYLGRTRRDGTGERAEYTVGEMVREIGG